MTHPHSNNREDQSSLNSYAKNGFLLIQNLVDNLILKRATGNEDAKITSKVASRTVEAHVQDSLATRMKGMARLFFDLPLKLPYLRFINGILREKETRIREGMKIMGLSNTASIFLGLLLILSSLQSSLSSFLSSLWEVYSNSLLLDGSFFGIGSIVFALWLWDS